MLSETGGPSVERCSASGRKGHKGRKGRKGQDERERLGNGCGRAEELSRFAERCRAGRGGGDRRTGDRRSLRWRWRQALAARQTLLFSVTSSVWKKVRLRR